MMAEQAEARKRKQGIRKVRLGEKILPSFYTKGLFHHYFMNCSIVTRASILYYFLDTVYSFCNGRNDEDF